MDMQGSRQLAVTQQQAWDALNNPETLKACIAGCDRFEANGPDQYVMGMGVKIGPVAAKFTGNITLSEVSPPRSYTIAFDGQGGVAGFGKGSAQVALEPNDAGCELQYTVNAQVGGKIAQLGQRLIDGVAKSMAEDFFKRFDQQMQAKYPAQVAVSEDVATQASDGPTAQASVTANTVPTEVPDLPKRIPIAVWVGVAIAIAVVGYLAMR